MADLALLYARGREAWPELELSEDAFVAHASRHGEASADFAADLFLACACAEGVSNAIERFEEKLLPELERGFAKVTATPEERAEAKQQLLERLFVKGKIADYAATGPLALWVRVAALRTLHNVVVRKPKETSIETELLDALPAESVDPELLHLQNLYRAAFREAFAAGLAVLSVEDRALLHQRFIGGLTQQQLAAAYQVHVNTIARWLEKAREKLESAIHRDLELRLKVNRDELKSILRLVRSQLDISLGALTPR
jgi:RNA polymerase sigma-70 factor (ECF subfamily)